MKRWIILPILSLVLMATVGCGTMTLVQRDFDDGVARGFAELDKAVVTVDDGVHRLRHGY